MKEKKYTHGFKVPEDYFESFEESVFKNIELKSLPNETGFKAPDGYFDNVEEIISKAISISEEEITQKETKVISIFSKKIILWTASVAACIAIAFSISNRNDTPETIEMASIDSYIEEGNLGMDIYDVTAMLDVESISFLEQENDVLSNTIIESYLLETIEDNTLLIE